MNVPLKKTMMPINVTHTAIANRDIRRRLLSPGSTPSPDADLPKASSNLRHMLSSIVHFFADRYRQTFGFQDGPPLHDALTIAYVSLPELFTTKRYRIDIELAGVHTVGETVADIWDYHHCDDTWGPGGKNCLVAKTVDVSYLCSS